MRTVVTQPEYSGFNSGMLQFLTNIALLLCRRQYNLAFVQRYSSSAIGKRYKDLVSLSLLFFHLTSLPIHLFGCRRWTK